MSEESVVVTEASGGMKGDGGKRDWGLVDWPSLDRLVDVLTFGARKYSANNWQKVSPARYKAAVMRHWSLYMQGELNDTETNLPHLAHMMCSLMFLMWFDRKDKKPDVPVRPNYEYVSTGSSCNCDLCAGVQPDLSRFRTDGGSRGSGGEGQEDTQG